ncbi:globin domain-containing protein [Spirosoma spitsbergense]|uniref:globin domain-containing protein n=1 Tax=Spirosoma spitsbergense TaxID=431554 RepID=UPI0003675E6A|nr:globin domain-containing protein [Spirosoma spitsbergense]
MTTEQKQLIKATVPALKEHGVLLTTHFYQRLFTHYPDLKTVFDMANQESGRQPIALASAVLAYAQHIDNPSVLEPALTRIGHKHTSLNIRPEHYPIVGEQLLASISEVLGAAATPQLLDAWAAAYGQLASLMIGIEASLYAAKTETPAVSLPKSGCPMHKMAL